MTLTPDQIVDIIMLKHNEAFKKLNEAEIFSHDWKRQATAVSVLTDILVEIYDIKENKNEAL